MWIVSEMTMEPLVSVVICVYNAGPHLRPALLSVINQTYKNLEVLVVDDGSTDGCLDAVQDLLADARVRVFRQANAGKPAALNRALNNARGEFYAVHDADDISYPKRIEKQLEALLNEPRLAAIYCGYELIIDGTSMARVFAPKSEEECRRLIDQFRMPGHDPTGMYRMSVVGQLRYNESLILSEGYDYILRIGERHPMVVLGECLYRYRVLPDSLTKRVDSLERFRLWQQALKRACDRRGLDLDNLVLIQTVGTRESRNEIAAHFVKSVLDERRAGNLLAAFKTGLQCTRLQPLNPYFYKPLFYVLMPEKLINVLKGLIVKPRRVSEFKRPSLEHRLDPTIARTDT
jgi:glycosyltransferase involved in cell wall biosynthesis